MAKGKENQDPQDPNEIFGAVDEILGSPRDETIQPFAVGLSGETAFFLLTHLHTSMSVVSEVQKAVDWASRNIPGAEDPPSDVLINPESIESSLYDQLLRKVPVEVEEIITRTPKSSLPESISLDLTVRDVDFLNGYLIEDISHRAGLLVWEYEGGETNSPVVRSVYSRSLSSRMSAFLDLNTAFVNAGAAPRPAYTQFLQGLQGK